MKTLKKAIEREWSRQPKGSLRLCTVEQANAAMLGRKVLQGHVK